jgi:hypothetical protein
MRSVAALKYRGSTSRSLSLSVEVVRMAALSFMPVTGLWWNPDESGSGYNFQMQHGVMVATMFAYTTDGNPVWYYGVGRPTSAGTSVTVSGSLDRYRGGQCVSCAYRPPSPAGSDGADARRARDAHPAPAVVAR